MPEAMLRIISRWTLHFMEKSKENRIFFKNIIIKILPGFLLGFGDNRY
jgi:hypothetical protein